MLLRQLGETQIDSDEYEQFDAIKARFSCAICLSIVKNATMTPCGHLFCTNCLNEWADTVYPEIQCPKCRSWFKMENAIISLDGFHNGFTRTTRTTPSSDTTPRLPQGKRKGQIFLYMQDFTESPSLYSIISLTTFIILTWEVLIFLITM